ncbi:MAG: hypothetical protein LKK46_00250 [Ancrocorticia sp.]|nr:hypothetical protein [Ancrocorticia sp.]
MLVLTGLLRLKVLVVPALLVFVPEKPDALILQPDMLPEVLCLAGGATFFGWCCDDF